MTVNALDVSIIINYKTAALVKDAVASVIEKSKGFTYEIIVVDNSEDAEEFKRLSENPCIKPLDAKSNLGFGKANNLGASIAKGKYLYFLNSDTLLMNNAIYELKKFLDEHEDASIVGSNLYTKDRQPNHSFYPYETNVKSVKRMNLVLTLMKKRIFYHRADFNFSGKPLKISGYVTGASLMIRKEDFDVLGGFDKDIFMYAEESLLCYRLIHKLHKNIYNVPSSKIIHFEGGSFKKLSYDHIKTYIDGNVIYYTKAFGLEEAHKYLRTMKRIYAKKKIIASLLRNDDRKEQFSLSLKAIDEKLKEMGYDD